MITFNEAINIIESIQYPAETETIHFTSSLNRVLSEDILSDINMPPFNKSAMDGFACRKKDLNNVLDVIETIAAGCIPRKKTGINQCSRIMTGAMVPNGADFVIMKEHVETLTNNKIKRIRESSNENICFKGEDVKAGDFVIPRRTLILPHHIALLASTGNIEVQVYKQPRIAIISSGNELVEPSQIPNLSQIRNSNSYQMLAQSVQLGIKADNLGIVKDDEAALINILTVALEKYDLVLISGGVSVGDYDFVPKALSHINAEILFHGLKAKPGKHLLFARKEGKYIFGLPGNPVSSFVQFEIMVKPLIYKMMGYHKNAFKHYIPLKNEFKRKKSEVLEFVPIEILTNGDAQTLEYHGSAHISAYTKANGIMEIPIDTNEIKKGEKVYVRPF